MNVLNIISYVVIAIGVIFMLFGVLGIYKFKNFYPRMLAASKVDTVGVITVIIGVMIRHGFSFFSAKALIILIVLLIISPLVTHIVTRSAYLSGYTTGDDTNVKEGSNDKEQTKS